jgi:hypothetical protein
MDKKSLLVIVVMAGGLYLLYRVGKASGSPMVGSSFLDTLFPGLDNLTPAQRALLPYQRTTAAGNVMSLPTEPASAPMAQPTGAGVAAIGLVGGSAVTAATIASKLSLGLSGGLVATGIGAGAAVIAWGVIDKGWFRGGEEGVKVNPNRDVFLSQFANFDYTRDSSNPPGFYGLSLVLTHANRHDLFDALVQSRTVDAMTAAINQIVAVVSAMTPEQWIGVHQELINYGVEAA